MTAAFRAADNAPNCTWQVEGDELEELSNAWWDHADAEHPGVLY
jgi:predicted small metal-binding protein